MKKLLSIILASSMICSSAYAAPVMISGVESTAEIVEEQPLDNYDSEAQSEPSSLRFAYVAESTQEDATDEKPVNVIQGDAFLMTEEFSGGDGTAEAPYEISDAADLELFSKNINSGIGIRSYYKLTGNIDLGGEEWTPVGYFTASGKYSTAFQGSFDGCGYTVSNFKITTSDTPYIGFFGLVLNGEIKNLNLDNATVDIDKTSTVSEVAQSYVGVLAGRIVGNGIGGKCTITNCHITNSSVSLEYYDKDVYAGGLAGFMIAGANADCYIFGVSTDCNVYVSVNASEYKDKNGAIPTPYQAYASSLFGYLGALTDCSFSLRKAKTSGNVTADCLISPYVTVFAGGLIAQTATKVTDQIGGNAVISACHSSSNVTAKAQLCAFAGGLAGNISSTENFLISDCYTSGDIKAGSYGVYWYRYYDQNVDEQKVYGYSALGGLVGQIDFEGYNTSMGKPISRCYSSCNVTYTPVENANKEESYEGGFAGYSFAPLFANCYILEDQTVSGLEIFQDSSILVISSEASKTADGYEGFDFDSTWTFDSSSDYPYPVLKNVAGVLTFYNQGKRFEENYFGEDGKAYAPASIPTKTADDKYVYTFSHWSLTEDGEPFDFENGVLEGDTAFHAVFSAQKQVYKVSFMSEGKAFGKVLDVDYGDYVTLSDAVPSKSDTSKYRYEFEYWSLTENGSEVDFDTYTVTGNVTLYAVFREINKSAWNGEVADSFSDGYGTKSLPYIISSAEEFALFAKVINEGDSDYTDCYFALGSDIHLGYNSWTPIGTKENPYGAYLDGNGYSVSCFVIEGGDYAGLFGYIYNGTVVNLIVSEFEIDYDSYTSTDKIYVGGLAGYVTARGQKTPSVIDRVFVSPSKFEISASAKTIYAGSIAGYLGTDIGYSKVTDSYATADISVTNTYPAGHIYAGGLFGYMYTYALSLASAKTSYFTGSVTVHSESSCYAGGLVGLIDSYGSSYLPPVSTSDAELNAEIRDYDIMLENCFTAASVNASVSDESGTLKAYAGAITADIYQYAYAQNVFYQRNKAVFSSTNSIYICANASSVAQTSLNSADFIENTIGFDFDNTWTFISSVEYPVLKVMYGNKPILRIDSLSFEDGVLSAKVLSYSAVPSYTVVVAVYNERNQLIASRRAVYRASQTANELSFEIEGLRQPYRIKVSAIDSSTFVPLFTAVERFI